VSRSDAQSTPSRRLTRRASIAVLAGAGAAALLAGCSSGQIAETAEVRPSVQGVNVDVGSLALRDLTVQYPDGRGYDKGSDAPLVVRIANNGGRADTLESVETDAAASVSFVGETTASASATPSGTPSGTPSATGAAAGPVRLNVALPAGQLVVLVRGTNDYLLVKDLRRALAPGQSLRLVFTFEHAGSVTVDVPVGVPASITARPSASDTGHSSGE
jgi:copper(I)-binding protein